GFTVEHMVEYLALPVRTLGLGSLLVPRVLFERGNWQAITARARAFVEFAANPHANAARFLSLMGVAQQPRMGVPGMAPAQIDPKVIVSAVPTMPVPPGAAAAAVAAANAAGAKKQPKPVVVSGFTADLPEGGGHAPAAANPAGRGSGELNPWDSRPIDQSDDEDWLR
ncbi:MAG TPA: hypothetical protein VF510_20020, partial [Ktedonobacterales bacterium]